MQYYCGDCLCRVCSRNVATDSYNSKCNYPNCHPCHDCYNSSIVVLECNDFLEDENDV